jgi:hypothetical protein
MDAPQQWEPKLRVWELGSQMQAGVLSLGMDAPAVRTQACIEGGRLGSQMEQGS